ncbi:MAG TPA: DNA polymerase ligase N-terminal domain-containing protein [Candidatus Thermoplasmatota archaeon]|nr:DNA polymerase ligase N-terminal domain-containing protein [Candidatus Thermoplasmatota archaeon]
MYPGQGRNAETERALQGWQRPVYMVHEHHSRSHHFDLRLEFDGVLRSWAVPKGLSTEPGVRRLAMEVPDHALAYAPFEGTIAEGSYGAGKVEIWDRGTFKVKEQDDDTIVLDIQGERIHGVYHLRRTAMGGDRRKWLVSLEGSVVAKLRAAGQASSVVKTVRKRAQRFRSGQAPPKVPNRPFRQHRTPGTRARKRGVPVVKTGRRGRPAQRA